MCSEELNLPKDTPVVTDNISDEAASVLDSQSEDVKILAKKKTFFSRVGNFFKGSTKSSGGTRKKNSLPYKTRRKIHAKRILRSRKIK